MTAVRQRRWLVGGLGLALLWLAAAAGAAEVREATLANGLRVLLQEDRRSPVVALQVWYRVGSRNERVGLTGISHFLEHMMFKGTPRYGPGAYAALLERHGAQHNAYTSQDATVYWALIPAEQVDLLLELEADRMQHLTLDPAQVQAERRVILEERRTRSEDDPVGALAETFHAVAFLAHPYRLPVIGFVTDIERITAEDLRAWYRTYYVPNNALLVAVGDFDAGALLDRIRARFGPIPRGPEPPAVGVVEPEQWGERRVWLRREARLPVVFAGYPVPNFRHPDAYALEVLQTILAGGRASRLHRRLVVEARLALDAGGDYTRLSLDPDVFTFYATVLPGRTVEEVERALASEVERLRTEPVAPEELERARNQIEAGYLFAQDPPGSRAATLARYELAGGWRLRDRFLPGIRAVTADAVRRAAERYFVRDRRTTAILLPVEPAGAAPAR